MITAATRQSSCRCSQALANMTWCLRLTSPRPCKRAQHNSLSRTSPTRLRFRPHTNCQTCSFQGQLLELRHAHAAQQAALKEAERSHTAALEAAKVAPVSAHC